MTTKYPAAADLASMVDARLLRKLHTSLFRGYVSRVDGPDVVPYKGRFGEGYALLSPNWDSTNYSYITYYVLL